LKEKNPSNNVINLPGKALLERDTAVQKKSRKGKGKARVIAITSGKGGVGKTNIVANLGFAFSRLGKKVLILDADLGLGNLDVLLGLAPKYNLSHVISGEKAVRDITIEGPGNINILPASSGIQELTRLNREQKIRILSELDRMVDLVDVLLIDTAAGISSNVMYFNVTAQEIMVVVTPEPTSITDAYALMKVLSVKYSERNFKLLVNMAADAQEAYDVFRQLSLVSDRFLDIEMDYVGHVIFDKKMTTCVRHQKVMSEMYPHSEASICFGALARKIGSTSGTRVPMEDTHFFWKQLFRNELE